MIPIFRKIRKKMADENRPFKYMRYAIGEIILVVIGILIALQVNNWNTDRIDQKRMEKYAKSLIQDLKKDIEMMEISQFQAEEIYYKIDSLRNYMAISLPEELSNADLFVLTNDAMYRPYMWSRSTLIEIKSSGNLGNIKNDNLEKKLIAYETFSYHLDEDYKGDESLNNRASELTAHVLNLNSPYFSQMQILEIERFNDEDLDLFNTKEYQLAKANDLALNTYDKGHLTQFLNTFILIQNAYRIRSFKEMEKLIDDANELISILKNEYNL